MTTIVCSASDPESILSEFGMLIGFPSLGFDSNRCCQLAFDGRWLVTLAFVATAQNWLLSCPLTDGRLQIQHGSQTAMLRANFMGAGCGNGALCIAPDGKPCLQFHLPQGETSAQRLLDEIEKLLCIAETWADRLLRGESAGEEAPVAAAKNSSGERPPSWLLNRV